MKLFLAFLALITTSFLKISGFAQEASPSASPVAASPEASTVATPAASAGPASTDEKSATEESKSLYQHTKAIKESRKKVDDLKEKFGKDSEEYKKAMEDLEKQRAARDEALKNQPAGTLIRNKVKKQLRIDRQHEKEESEQLEGQ